jgi:hypothetical protein
MRLRTRRTCFVNAWSDKQVWQNIFAVLREDAGFEEIF